MKARPMLRWFFLFLVSFMTGSAAVLADSGEKPPAVASISVITITGRISNRTLEIVSASALNVKGDPIPAGLIVLLDSSGGDGMVAMKIGRLLRQARAHVFVTGQCSSACMFVLASGVVRGAPAYTVGIHRGRITVTDAEGKILKEVNASENPKAAAALRKFEYDAEVYFAEMGMPPSLFDAMQAHTQKGVYRLSHTEITKFGLVGFEARYFNERVRFYDAQNGAYKMNGTELRRRTARVASRCGEFQSDRKKFIACYSDVLRDRDMN